MGENEAEVTKSKVLVSCDWGTTFVAASQFVKKVVRTKIKWHAKTTA
jgi:hypothetical protein